MTDPVQLVLSKLTAKPAGEGKWTARCPAHEDQRPSLSIARGHDGAVLLKCHAGCPTPAITAALGLKMSELFPAVNGSASARAKRAHSASRHGRVVYATAAAAVAALEAVRGRPSGIWTYRAAQGNPVGLVLRWDAPEGTKTILPVSRFPDGWRVKGMAEPRPLYGLPELLAAPEPVFLTEGEKAADAGRSIGFVTTTTPHGADSPHKADLAPLAGREVVILPDADDAGEKYAATVVTLLHELSPRPRIRVVRLPGLPPKGDLVEYVAARQAAGLNGAAIRVEIEHLATAAQQELPAGERWGDPQPIPLDLPHVQPFDLELLPKAFRIYVDDIAERMQCAPDFPAVAMMVAEAGVVGRKIGIRPKRHDDWLVVPNLWGAVVGRPGIMKTPAIRQPYKFPARLQVEAERRYERKLLEYEQECEIVRARKKLRKEAIEEAVKKEATEKAVRKKKADPQAVAKQFNIAEPKKPTPNRYTANDSTVEKLGELLNENPNGLTVFRDELVGLLRQLDKEGQEAARAFYLEAWDGLGTFDYDRIGRGHIHIESVTLSLMGSIQPGRLLDYLGGALRGGADDDGLVQRFQLMVYPDVSKKWRNVDRWPDTQAKAAAWAVFQRLDTLDPVAIRAEAGDEDHGVSFLHFSPGAQGLFDDWRAELEVRVRSGDEHPAIESHLAKYRSLVPSLALLIFLADGGSGPVDEEATRKALGWVAYLESHARRIYGMVINSAAIAAKALGKRVMAGDLKDGFVLRDIYRKHWTGLSQKQAVEQGVDLLLELGWLKEEVEDTRGRPRTRYRINPALFAKAPPDTGAKSAKSPHEPSSGTSGTGPRAPFQGGNGDSDDEWAEV